MENQSSPIQTDNLTKKQRRELKRREKLQRRQEEVARTRRSRMISWVIVGLILVGSVVGIIFLSKSSPDAGESSDSVEPISDQELVLGNRSAAVSIIEYGDYQCPACAISDPIARQLVDDYKDKVAFSFRHFPLRQVHKNAQIASQAAEAAGRQEKYWEIHRLLFDRQKDWSNVSNAEEIFVTYAEELGLDKDRFKQDIASQEVVDAVNADYNSGVAAGISATPTFYLNGEKIENPSTLEQWRTLIDPLLPKEENNNADNTAPQDSNTNQTSESESQK